MNTFASNVPLPVIERAFTSVFSQSNGLMSGEQKVLPVWTAWAVALTRENERFATPARD
jgi:hypothetical protein